MRIGIISDIHSNFFYLKKVLNQLEKFSPESIYCLGDLVGYYDQPNQVIESLIENNIFCIKGNHDKYLLGELPYDKERDDLYRISYQKLEISNSNKEFLKNLPDYYDIEIAQKKFYMTHSLPFDSETYLNQPNQLNRDFIKDYDYYLHGHTHRCNIQFHFGTCLVNPGSVGQPRDYFINPSFVVIDLDLDRIFTERVEVNMKTYVEKLKNLDFNKKVISALMRKRLEG